METLLPITYGEGKDERTLSHKPHLALDKQMEQLQI